MLALPDADLHVPTYKTSAEMPVVNALNENCAPGRQGRRSVSIDPWKFALVVTAVLAGDYAAHPPNTVPIWDDLYHAHWH